MSQGVRSDGRHLRVGIVLYGDLAYDGRVRREAATLARPGYQVALVCVGRTEGTPGLPRGVDVPVRRPTVTHALPGPSNPYVGHARSQLCRRMGQGRWLLDHARNVPSWGRLAIDACWPVDIRHANDLPGLVAIVPAFSRGAPVIYNSHEIFADAGTAARLPRAARLFLRGRERHLVAQAAAVVTVNEPLAGVLRHRYRPTRLVVAHNAPPRWDPTAERPDHLRQALSLGPDVPVILYHGDFSTDRGLVPLAEAMLAPGLERAHLAYVGFAVLTDELVVLSREPRFGGRIHVLPSVPPPRSSSGGSRPPTSSRCQSSLRHSTTSSPHRQAPRGARGRRPGPRERHAGDGADRP